MAKDMPDLAPSANLLYISIVAAVLAQRGEKVMLSEDLSIEMRNAAIDGYVLGDMYELVPRRPWWKRMPILRHLFIHGPARLGPAKEKQ
jgi:hypothetical protein